MKYYLIVASGKKRGFPIPISVDLFTMGSDHACQLRSQLPGIGHQHCALTTRLKKVFVRDLNSGAETIVNGQALPGGVELPLHAGDRLRIGPLEFVLQFKEKELSGRDAEEWALRSLDVDAEDQEGEEPEEGRPPPDTAAGAAGAVLDALRDMRGVVKGRLRIGHEDGITAVRFNDRHLVEEAELALVNRDLLNYLKRPHQRVLLDFKNVTRLSSAAADMILNLHRFLKTNHSKLALCRLRESLHPALESRSGLEQIPYFHDKKAALAANW